MSNKFEIHLDQAQLILNTLGEYKAKEVLPAIDALRNLTPIEEVHPKEIHSKDHVKDK